MLSQRSVMALMAVLALSVKVAQSAIAAPAVCGPTDVGLYFCLDCLTKARCMEDTKPPEDRGACTVPGEVCTVTSSSGFAVCTPLAGTACDCEFGSWKCDPYNPDLILFCTNDGPAIIDDCSVTSETCIDAECIDPSATPAPSLSPDNACTNVINDELVLITPNCTTVVYCVKQQPDFIFECPPGTYYDMDERGCNSLPPVPCAGDCDTGACPDKSDCSKWYVCTDGVVEEEETCTGLLPYFDFKLGDCSADINTCTGNELCTFDSTTITETTPTTVVSSSDGSSTGDGSSSTGDGSSSTGDGSSSTGDGSSSTGDGSSSTGDGSSATTSKTLSTSDSTTTTSRPATCTAANVGQRYPFDGDCKKYWTCYEISNGNYDYVESTCLGNYVFNPDTGYCDLPANVPGCLPTS